MRDAGELWDRLAQLAQPHSEALPGLPAGFADRVCAQMADRIAEARSRIAFRLVGSVALAASLLAAAVGFWSWDALASEWEVTSLSLENIVAPPLP